MANTKHSALGTVIAAHSTSLNSLANNANSAASSAIDNGTALDLYVDVRLNVATQGGARAAGAVVLVFLVAASDGTNYARVNESTAELLCVFPLDAATTATLATVRDVPIPPGKYEVFVRNATGQAFAASGNTLDLYPHSIVTA